MPSQRPSKALSSPPPKAEAQRPALVWGAALLVLAAIGLYGGAWHGGFIWDDLHAIVDNEVLKRPDALRTIWFSFATDDYWPLANSLYLWEWLSFGTSTLPYHLLNTLMHGLNAVVLWSVLRRLGLRWGYLVALLFVAHPVNTEAVAWLVQIKTTLCLLFCLVSLRLYLEVQTQRKSWFYPLALLSFSGAMLSKSAAVFWPAVILATGAWQSKQWTLRNARRALPFFLVAVGLAAVNVAKYSTVPLRTHDYLSHGGPWPQRLAAAGWNLSLYLRQALFPFNLMFVYPSWHLEALSAEDFLPTLVVSAAFCGLLLCAWRARHEAKASWLTPVTAAGAYYALALSPSLGLFYIQYMRYAPAADHYQYLALPGLLALVVEGGAYLLGKLGQMPQKLGLVAYSVVLLLFSVLTVERSRVYRDATTLWQDSLEKNPESWLAHGELGNSLREHGQLAAAAAHYEAVVRLQPKNAEAHNVLGIMLLQQGKSEAALKEYEAAVACDDESAAAHLNLGAALQMLGRTDAALTQYEQALKFNPALAEAHSNLANGLFRKGDYQRALVEFRAAAELHPESAEEQYNYGAALLAVGATMQAKAAFAKAEALQPGFAKAHAAPPGQMEIRASDLPGEAPPPAK